MSSSGTKAEIIERFVEHCQRPTEMPLGFLEIDEDIYACPLDSAELVSTLTDEFSIESLVESGLGCVGETVGMPLTVRLAPDALVFHVLNHGVGRVR